MDRCKPLRDACSWCGNRRSNWTGARGEGSVCVAARLTFRHAREDTLNLDERLLRGAFASRTKAIVPVHYAGVACELDEILLIAEEAGVPMIEDAAQGLLATYCGRELGSIGRLGALSFHETKNVISGEGGALLINEPELVERAEILLEKGTDRNRFFRGEVDKYTWVDIGGSYAPSEIIAAFLWAQFGQAQEITRRRLEIWHRYHQAFAEAEESGLLRCPVVPEDRTHNAHMYYLLLPDKQRRDGFIRELAERDVHAVFHSVPLHSSAAGRRYGRASGELRVTDDVTDRLVRLPLWVGISDDVEFIVGAVLTALGAEASRAASLRS